MLRVKSKKFNAVFLWPSMSLNILLCMKRLEVQKNKNILLIVFILYQYYNKDDFNCQVDSAAPFLIMKTDSGTLWNSNVSLESCTRQAVAFLVLFLCWFFVIFCIFEGFRIKSLPWTKCNQLTVLWCSWYQPCTISVHYPSHSENTCSKSTMKILERYSVKLSR